MATHRPGQQEVGQLGITREAGPVQVGADDVVLDRTLRLTADSFSTVADADLDPGERLRGGPEMSGACVVLIAGQRLFEPRRARRR